MKNPVVNLGKRVDDRDKDYDPTQLCNHCRLKLSGILTSRHGHSIVGEILFEFGDHLFQVKCLR